MVTATEMGNASPLQGCPSFPQHPHSLFLLGTHWPGLLSWSGFFLKHPRLSFPPDIPSIMAPGTPRALPRGERSFPVQLSAWLLWAAPAFPGSCWSPSPCVLLCQGTQRKFSIWPPAKPLPLYTEFRSSTPHPHHFGQKEEGRLTTQLFPEVFS